MTDDEAWRRTPPRFRCPTCSSFDVEYWGPRTLHCRGCRLTETSERTETDPRTEDLWAMERRWENPERPPYTIEDLDRDIQKNRKIHEDNARRATFPQERSVGLTLEERQQWRISRAESSLHDYPSHPELRARIIAAPEDDAPRREYAAWLKVQPQTRFRSSRTGEWVTNPAEPIHAAWIIDAQLDIAERLRRVPQISLDERVKGWSGGSLSVHELRTSRWDVEPLAELQTAGLIAYQTYFRGFVEEVTMKAKWFLELADELYAYAPIRHLCLTYCNDYLDKLVDSPHLERIRRLDLGSRHTVNKYIRLNEWTDEAVEELARSPRLRGLRYLSFDDATQLTERALVALARSPYLTELSHVSLNMHRFFQTVEHPTWGGFGHFHKEVSEHRALGMRRIVEAEVGYVPWLHPEEHYAAYDPDPEAVVEHPIALKPEVQKRRGQEVDPDAPVISNIPPLHDDSQDLY